MRVRSKNSTASARSSSLQAVVKSDRILRSQTRGQKRSDGRIRSRVINDPSKWRDQKRNDSIKDSLKHSMSLHDIESKKASVLYSFVFVGNLDPVVTEEDLAKVFGHCGKILRIQIRCSRGQGITIGLKLPDQIRTPQDKTYATIEFNDRASAYNALQLGKTELFGNELVVTTNTADLPEVKAFLSRHLRGMLGNTKQPSEGGPSVRDVSH